MGIAHGPRAVVAGPATTSSRTHLPDWKALEETTTRSAWHCAEHSRPAANGPQPNRLDTVRVACRPGNVFLRVRGQ